MSLICNIQTEEGSENAEESSNMQASANSYVAVETNVQKNLPDGQVETEVDTEENDASVENARKSSMQAGENSSFAVETNVQNKRPYGEVEFEAGSQQITKVSKIEPLESDADKPVINMCATLNEEIPATELSTETTTLTVMNHWELMYQLRILEADLVKPLPCFIQKRPYLNVYMRNYQVTFLMHVFKDMNEQILHKAVYFMDTYLSHRDILIKEMKILAAAAGMLACQFEKEGFQTSIYWIEITGNTFTESELLQKIEMIKTALHNRLERPTIISFIRHIYSVATVPTNTRQDFLVKYICDLTLIGDAYVGFAPSLVASAAIALARHIFYCNCTMWPQEFTNIIGYAQSQLHEPFSLLHRTLQRAATKSRFRMVKSKFTEANYGRIAVSKEVLKPRVFYPGIFF